MAESSEEEDANGDLLLTLLHEEHQDPPTTTTSNQPQDLHHHLRSIAATIMTRQLPSQGLSFQLWPAASSLVSLLDLDPSPLLLPLRRPLRVLELGSGTGLAGLAGIAGIAGIAAAALLGADVTLTDLPHVLPNLLFNARANAASITARGGSACVRQLRWGNRDDVEAFGEEFDVVMAADVVYYDHLFDPLLQTLGFFVKGEGTAFVMAHLRRWKKRDSVFFRRARKTFRVEAVHVDPPLPGSRIGVTIYRFTVK